MTPPTEDTCLFTSAPLNESTKVEHTIPESLGGRVRSSVVSSTDFNEGWGETLVPALKKPYAMIMNRLGPLLPGIHQSGQLRVDVRGEAPGLALDDEGVLTRQNLDIVARDEETNRPRSVVGTSEKAIRGILKQAGARDDQIVFSMVPASTATTFYTNAPVIWKELEVAALTSTLLTFDHLTRDTGRRFTRSDELLEARQFIRQAVDTRRIQDGEPLNRMSLGMQYENLELFRELRTKVSQDVSPFEHTLIASANVATRTLDLVWNAFGFDPFGFRFRNWTGEGFTLVFVNPILAKTQVSELVEIPSTMLLCKPTDRRAFPDQFTTGDEMQQAMAEISCARQEAWNDAVYLVEMEADDLIRANLALAGDLADGETRMRQLIERRLIRMYGRKAGDSDFVADVESIVDERMGSVRSEMLNETYFADAENADISWDQWLAAYRDCLGNAVKQHGKPGDAFQASSGIIHDKVDAQPLGQEPDRGD